MFFRTTFFRTLIEAGLPACVLLAGLMLASEGNLNGIFGLLTLLAIIFPGLWGALRLQIPQTSLALQAGYCLAFCALLGLSNILTMLGARFMLQALHLYTSGSQGNALGKLAPFALAPGIIFFLLRASMALVKGMRQWPWQGCLKRLLATASLAGILVALGAGIYALASRPYTAHATSFPPKVRLATPLTDFSQGADGWQAANAAVQMQVTDRGLQLSYALSAARSYSVTWQLQPEVLSQANGLQICASSEVTTYLRVELEELGGGRYNAWADLLPTNEQPLVFSNFVPSIQAQDENGQLDWGQIVHWQLTVYPDGADSDLLLKKIEAISTEQTSWQVAQSPHFWIRYPQSEQAVVADVQHAAESRFESLVNTLGYRPLGRIPITIVSSHAELEQQLGQPRPGWVVGTATPDALIVLTPRRFSPWFNQRDYATIFELVPHELTHLLLVQKIAYPGFLQVPGWLNEGLATSLAGQGGTPVNLQQAAEQGKLPTLQELNSAFSGQAALGEHDYASAGSAVSYLTETYGAEKISLLIEALSRGSDFEAAFEQNIGIDVLIFEQQWRAALLANAP